MQRDGDHVPFVRSGSYPIRAGNDVRPLVDGGPAFDRICRAVESARRSVWVTVAFHDLGFEMPGGRGSLFDVLDAARARELDVRVIFWRHPRLAEISPDIHFAGTAADRALLRERGSRFLARWDRAYGPYCQHQKSWMVDCGTDDEVTFVGGINLDRGSVVEPGHVGGGGIHDVYLELRGPASTDVHHNFVQRWNEASDRLLADGAWPDVASQTDLPFPGALSPSRGAAPVQIQRTVRRELYRNGHPAVDAEPFAIADGEFSVIDQYRCAIDAARSSIYIEDQAIASAEVVDRLHAAAERGVEVVFLVPADAGEGMTEARAEARYEPFFASLARLGEHPRFTLAGIAASGADGDHRSVYVHAKIALVDDVWCTIGSTNVANRSFYGDTELNASFWHGPTVRALRTELLAEHLGRDTSAIGDREALRLYAEVARENAERRAAGQPLQGLAFSLDASTYALPG